MVRILVVDDKLYVREWIRGLLKDEPDRQVCGEAADGQQAVDLAANLQPNLIVLDVHLRGLTGYDAARQILRTSPEIFILILSIHDDPRYAQAAEDCGAHGFLAKHDAAAQLVPAISILLRGEFHFPSIAAH